MTTYTSDRLLQSYETSVRFISGLESDSTDGAICIPPGAEQAWCIHHQHHWSQLWEVLAHSYFLISHNWRLCCFGKGRFSTGINLNINGKHKQFHAMERLSVLKQMDFTAGVWSSWLLSGDIMTVQIIHSSFGLLPFICIAQSFLVIML